MQLEALDSYIV